ncbi:multidrug resistance protein, MATE family [Saccharicrinis carchari]|uniref:Multidrug-efflux transporter n=1 Tax=Saccharicrinis carchari TaxID=1168039 RepID=A0A521D3S5_SACCC|nr:MATE family efflux transporter [Saccharicrinis carchari]SMO66307.1 multidrug resistance protein, MATE family [Saccharicrinis carchari]
MLRYLKKSFYHDYSPHYWPNFKLALPVVLSQAGQMVVGLADTIMVGQLGATELAAVSFANSIFTIGLVVNIGLAIAVTPLVGKAHGANKPKKCGYWLKQGLVANFIFALLQIVLMFGVSFTMPFMGQESAVVQAAIPYYLILVSSILPFSIFMVFKQFSEGIANTRIAMVITLVANITNIALNYILIFGKAGFPQLGIDGAGWATLISRILMPLAFIIVFIRLPFFELYKASFKKAKIRFKEIVSVIKVGVPIGGQMVIEVFAFSMGAIMMGWINQESMAAHQIVISMASVTYMMSMGLSAAATIKVSNYLGAGDWSNLKHSAYAIIHKVIIFMFFTAILFIGLRNFLPTLFVDDVNVINIAATLMVVAGIFQLFDGLQAVWLGALRGLEDVRMPTVIAFITWIILALPISYICTFVLNMGPIGVWLGYLFGLFAGSILLHIRFAQMYRKMSNNTPLGANSEKSS